MIMQMIGMIALIGFGVWILVPAFGIFLFGINSGVTRSQFFLAVLFLGLGVGAIYLACKLSPFTVVVQS